VQLSCSALLILVVVAASCHSRRSALTALWLIWLLIPAVRRVLGLFVPVPPQDPLSVVPFLATAIVAGRESFRVNLDPRTRRILLLAACGFAFGVPLGLRNPTAFLFDGFAYIAALSGLILGYAEVQAGDKQVTLSRLLLLFIPIVAVYGTYQYFNLLPWDKHWFETVEFASLGAPQKGHPRIWGTLNAPGTFAPILALSILAVLSIGHRGWQRVVPIVPLVLALAFTFVRSAWVGLVVALIVIAAASRGRALVRVLGLVGVVVAVAIAGSAVSPAGQAVVERATTFGSLGNDTSAQARTNTPERLLPGAIRSPFGSGLGSAGIASGLAESGGSDLKATDNGYLSLIIQLGPIGGLCVIAAMLWVAYLSASGIGHLSNPRDRAWGIGSLAMLVFLLVDQLGGEILYGLLGVVFWYLAGGVLARDRLGALESQKPKGASGSQRIMRSYVSLPARPIQSGTASPLESPR
jgi:hypothetical protein